MNDPKLTGEIKKENQNQRKDNTLKSKNKKELISITDENGNIYVTRADPNSITKSNFIKNQTDNNKISPNNKSSPSNKHSK